MCDRPGHRGQADGLLDELLTVVPPAILVVAGQRIARSDAGVAWLLIPHPCEGAEPDSGWLRGLGSIVGAHDEESCFG